MGVKVGFLNLDELQELNMMDKFNKAKDFVNNNKEALKEIGGHAKTAGKEAYLAGKGALELYKNHNLDL